MLKAKPATVPLLFLIAVIIPPLLFLSAFHQLSIELVVMLGILLICYYFLMQSKFKRWINIGLLLAILVLIVTQFAVLQNAIYQIYNVITDVYATSSNYTFEKYDVDIMLVTSGVLEVFGILFTLQIMGQYYFLIDRKSYFTSFILSAAFFFPTILYSTPQPWLLTGCIFFFWLMLFFTSYAAKFDVKYRKGYVRVGIYIGCCVALLMTTLFVVFPEKEYVLSNSASKARENFLHTIEGLTYDLFYGKEKTGQVDLGRAGNRYYTGTTQLIVKRDRKEQIYLKTFSGDIYKDNQWEMLPEDNYKKNKQIKWDSIRTWMNQGASDTAESESILITDKRTEDRYALMPYYMKSIDQNISIAYDTYAQFDEQPDTIKYEVWNKDTYDNQDYSTSYDDYERFVNENYKDVPSKTKELFDDVLSLRPEEASVFEDEIIEYVKSYLHSQCNYTLSPGSSPQDKDFIEYFLKENKQGYCVHFATTATLIFRYYGIPARYVEGYRVDSTDYNKDGIANVPDRNAHAWVEIFDAQYGWIPIEVTPSVTEDTTKPSTTPNVPQDPGNNDQPSNDPQNPNQNTPKNPKKQTLITDTPNSSTTTGNSISLKWIGFVVILIGLILAFFIQWKLRLKRHMEAMKVSQRKKAIGYLYAYLKELEPYGAVLSSECLEIAEKATFSQHDIEEEEYQLVYQYVQQERLRCYKKVSFFNKIKLKYWKALY